MKVLQACSEQWGWARLSAPVCLPEAELHKPDSHLRSANIYITTHNSEVTPDLFLNPSMSPCGFHSFLFGRSRKAAFHTEHTRKHWSGICQPGLNKTRWMIVRGNKLSHSWFCSSSKTIVAHPPLPALVNARSDATRQTTGSCICGPTALFHWTGAARCHSSPG